jgi:thioredoxin reductase/Pyruvate/2-oxoacid:ferredoxin oxidoreductase delta subunit
MDSLFTYLIAIAVVGFFVFQYWRTHRKQESAARAVLEQGPLFSEGPRAQHPHIDISACIGCGACVKVCPEGDVLGIVDGKARIIHGHKCIGHSLCAEACPVAAITMVMAKPSAGADIPIMNEQHETNVPNLFIAGELGGLALIKNAVNQGRDCVDIVAERLRSAPAGPSDPDVFDVLIVGAGPAGISASLRAAQLGLKAITLERETVGGTVSKYPRQKLVMTSPVEFPMHGKFSKTSLSKEDLLAFWEKVMARSDLNIHLTEPVETVTRDPSGIFRVKTGKQALRARAVVLALGRAGTPRKLGVPGEELPHVLYRLIEADHYHDNNILIVGGGDSAIEAAMGLAAQSGNNVTLSYRKGDFTRIKDRNAKRIQESMRTGKVNVVFNSQPIEFRVGNVMLEMPGETVEIPNDFVWIFAGGIPPSDFLRACGIAFHTAEEPEAPESHAAMRPAV